MNKKIKQLLRPIKKRLFRLFGIKELYKYGYMHPSHKRLDDRIIVYEPKNLYLYERAGMSAPAYIMNPRAKFIMKKGSGAAVGLLVIAGNHLRVPGRYYLDVSDKIKDELVKDKSLDQDVIVEEDVWMGAHVTLLSGAHIGRGCNIGAGTVVRGNIPPYAIVIGNPCKVVGFTFTPEEIVEHEKSLYPEDERIPFEVLKKNYEKYYIKRWKDIKNYIKL